MFDGLEAKEHRSLHKAFEGREEERKLFKSSID
jgi:hypothetical protein